MELEKNNSIESRINSKLQYMKNLVEKFESLSHFKADITSLTSILETMDNSGFFKDQTDLKFKLILALQDKIEVEFSIKRTCFDTSVEKYKLKGKTIIEVLEKYPPVKEKASDFDINNYNYSWLSLTSQETETILSDFLISIAPEETDSQIVRNFISAVRENMLVCFYHNFSHVTTVLQFVYVMWKRSQKIQNIFSKEEIFGICIAAISHDLNHSKLESSLNLLKEGKITHSKIMRKTRGLI